MALVNSKIVFLTNIPEGNINVKIVWLEGRLVATAKEQFLEGRLMEIQEKRVLVGNLKNEPKINEDLHFYLFPPIQTYNSTGWWEFRIHLVVGEDNIYMTTGIQNGPTLLPEREEEAFGVRPSTLLMLDEDNDGPYLVIDPRHAGNPHGPWTFAVRKIKRDHF